MTIFVNETYDSPRTKRGVRPTTTALYKVRSDSGDITRDQAYIALLNTIPTVRDFLLLNAIDLDPTQSGKVWNASVDYRVDPIPSEDAPLRFKGSTRAGRSKVMKSLETVSQTGRAGYPVQDFGQAIEVDEKGKVNGTDIYTPSLEFSLEIYIKTDFFTYAYMRRLYQFTPSTNLDRFGPFIPGECLFLGAEWGPAQSSEGDDLTRLTFYFIAGANETINVPGFTDPLTKNAHDHIWFLWEEFKDTGTGEILRRPAYGLVERNYAQQPLRTLGLGL